MEIESLKEMATKNVNKDCHNNEHVNNILNFGSGENVPEWTIKCQYRGKPGSASSFIRCKNWWCYDDSKYSGRGSISTVLRGNGRGKLDFGVCAGSKVKVYLNGNEIATATLGSVNQVVEFDFYDGSTLKIEEHSTSVLQFNSFIVIKCYD